jgi:signal transduction histidine kinase
MPRRSKINRTRWQLQERVKELTALHQAAKVLRRHTRSIDGTIALILGIIPPAWQYPDITAARIRYGNRSYATENFRATRWMQRTAFRVDRGKRGCIEVCYLERRPAMDEGPFLAEERALISTLAELLRLYFHRCLSEDAMEKMNRKLEQRVIKRTAELLRANGSLRREIEIRRDRDRQLRALASALTLTEENERREIAGNLHDHIGQALALASHKLRQLHGNAVFTGSEKEIEAVQDLVEQIIKYTRTLTIELSPPVLYELGLSPALSSLSEQFNKKHRLPVRVHDKGLPADISHDVRITLYTAARELLTNVVKHAQATQAILSIGMRRGKIIIAVADDGVGCPSPPVSRDGAGFGLFSIRERLRHFGGALTVESVPGQGTTATVIMPVHQLQRLS